MVEASVLVVGGGAIGGITAAKLAGAVRRVTVLDTNADHVARLRDPGLVYEEAGAEHRVRLDAVGTPEALAGEYDFALVGVKAPWHRAALEPLAARGGIGCFVSLGNGLIQDRMAEIVGGPDRLLACLVEWAGSNAGPGRLIRDTVGPMVVGELDGAERERTRRLARCLEAAGPVRISGNIRGQIWSKLLVNSTFTALSAVSGLRYGEVAAHPGGRVASFGLWAEGVRVAEAEGIALEPVLDADPHEMLDEGAREAALARMMAVAGNSRPSMLQDLEAGRTTEIDVINGGVARHGRERGVPTPLNDLAVGLVHSMERGERERAPAVLDEVATRATR
jgi:2-dehydropantoate 2-reductase